MRWCTVNIFKIVVYMLTQRPVCVCVLVCEHLLTCVFIFSLLQDLRYFKSEKTSRGILQEGWRDTQDPIMCSYKLVTVKFEVWGLQTRVEQFVHKVRGHASDVFRPFQTFFMWRLTLLCWGYLPCHWAFQVIRDVLLLGHRQAFAWVDEWIGTSVSTLSNLGFGLEVRG